MLLNMESYKSLSSDKKDDIKMDIINHYRKNQFLYDYRNSENINRIYMGAHTNTICR